jgi:hypothetical protein
LVDIIKNTSDIQVQPSEDKKVTTASVAKERKENLINDTASNGEALSIKSFFRVSKTTPLLPQKMVVQMIEMSPKNQSTNSNNTLLRHSLRSSTKKSPQIANNNIVANDETIEESTNQITECKVEVEKLSETIITAKNKDTNELKSSPISTCLSELKIPDIEHNAKSLISPSNTSLVSPTSSSNSLVPKKKKKLNDCIAMLTCKIQEKLGVNFFESSAPEILPNENQSNDAPKQEIKNLNSNATPSIISSNSPSHQNLPIAFVAANNVPQTEPIITIPSVSLTDFTTISQLPEPEQDEVIDLSIKKKSDDVKCETILIEERTLELFENDQQIKSSLNHEPSSAEENITIKREEKDIEKIEFPKISRENTPQIESVAIEDRPSSPEKAIVKEKSPVKEEMAIDENKNAGMISICNLKESFKISILKSKIPNLNEILNEHNVIKINNVTISESERRAFEEQKNRIMQILNKTKKTGAKKATKKVAANKKAVAARNRNVKKTAEEKTLLNSENVSSSAASEKIAVDSESKSEEQPKIDVVHSKIEEVIKTTNRIRCRRLSVVVDPIIHLSAFQHKNRKIRLTNNSQQNGFYDLLTNDQLFTLIEPQINKEISKKSAKANKSNPIVEAPQKEEENTKTLDSTETVIEKKNDLKSSKNIIHKKAPKKQPSKKANLRGKQQKQIPKIKLQQKKKVKVKTPAKSKQNVSKITETPIKEHECNSTSSCGKTTRSSVKNLKVMEDIDSNKIVEINQTNSDTSRSSETSNDVPLAKLVEVNIIAAEPEKEHKEEEKEEEKKIELVKQNNKKKISPKKGTKRATSQKSNKKPIKEKSVEKLIDAATAVLENESKDVIEPHVNELEETPKNIEIESSIEEKENEKLIEPLEKSVEKCVKNHKQKIPDKFDVFEYNEDSFFNDDDDNDIDQTDEKINAIVNNIINSSELIDSENDQLKQISSKNLFSSATAKQCLICNKTFRNEKMYAKHCSTNTHLLKMKRKYENKPVDMKEGPKTKESENQSNFASDETKIFRTKGALKTFDNVPIVVHTNKVEKFDLDTKAHEFKPIDETEIDSKILNDLKSEILTANNDNDDELSTKDKIFDSLFSNIENKLQAAANNSSPIQKFPFPSLTPQDSEIESSSTSWDLKHDADIEWDGENNDQVSSPLNNTTKGKVARKSAIKNSKARESVVSNPTKSLIMGKIFKKHRDREKQKTPQADAPNNKPGIKNSLDEIFDHLKNSAEIDDKVLTCPSPKTLLKSAGGTFSTQSSNSNDVLESASHSNNNNNNSNKNNNNNYNNVNANKLPNFVPSSKLNESIEPKLNVVINKVNSDQNNTLNSKKNNDALSNEEDNDGIGKRKSRRRCAIRTKTFAETWSSDEYEELHDTNDIISIINEIEKRESTKKVKLVPKCDDLLRKTDNAKTASNTITTPTTPILKPESTLVDKRNDKAEKKKSVQLQFANDLFNDKSSSTIKKRRMSVMKDGHKSDEEVKPIKSTPAMIKKRRMSCFVPSTIFNDYAKPPTNNKHSKADFQRDGKKLENCEDTKIQKKSSAALCVLNANLSPAKRNAKKHRKKPRNKVKNIAYDSDSDFEMNLNNKKSKQTAKISDSSSCDDDCDDDDNGGVKNEKEIDFAPILCTNNKTSQNATTLRGSNSNANELTMIKEPKLLPNDLNVVQSTTIASKNKAAITEDNNDPSHSAGSRTKRQSSEKLYYWSSSSSDSEPERGDTADTAGDGQNEESMVPHQPEQHGWIVGDSHKKLVTLLAHAKIKNKIN